MPETKKLGKIENAEIGFEDHGIFGFHIDFRYGSNTMQGTGWYSLANPYGGELLAEIMSAVGVSRWSKMVGKTVCVHIGENGLIAAIEKLPTEDLGGVFSFDSFFAKRGIRR